MLADTRYANLLIGNNHVWMVKFVFSFFHLLIFLKFCIYLIFEARIFFKYFFFLIFLLLCRQATTASLHSKKLVH